MPYRANNFTSKLIQCKQFDKYTKNCYKIVDQSVRRKKKKKKKKKNLLKNGVVEGRRNREKKEKRGRQRENLWEEKRPEGMIVRV